MDEYLNCEMEMGKCNRKVIESSCWGRKSSGEEGKERGTKGRGREEGRVKKGKITEEEGKGNDGKGN